MNNKIITNIYDNIKTPQKLAATSLFHNGGEANSNYL